MQVLRLISNRSSMITVGCFLGMMLYGFILLAEELEVKDPIANAGFLLIEKEMIRLSDVPRKSWSKQEEQAYRGLLFLENYFLNGGVSSWSMKVLHKLVRMRDNIKDLKKKAFLECEAWRILDHDLKNFENRELIMKIKEKRKFTNADHIQFRKFSSKKVASCIEFIGSNWTWQGPDYRDLLYDVKTKNAIESVKTYQKVQEVALPSN